ncbi:MAG: hypothetical protein R3B13_20880 [Polyangiaceae bacterium]
MRAGQSLLLIASVAVGLACRGQSKITEGAPVSAPPKAQSSLPSTTSEPAKSTGSVVVGPLERDAFMVAAVDDSVDPFAGTATVPVGMRLRAEKVSLGLQVEATRQYLFLAAKPDAPFQSAMTPFRDWLAGIVLPEGRRFAWGKTQPGTPADSGWRSYIVEIATVIDGTAVERVTASAPSEEFPHLALELTASGARSFEDFTRRHLGRRAALMIRGQVQSAPVIVTVIAGPKLTLTARDGEAATLLESLR